MSKYLVTARKWRPMRFEDVAGQDHVTVTLRNAISSSRLAHAYLFAGPRGVGKTTTARLLAKAVNCLNVRDSDPDNTCENCLEITEGRSFDVLEIDGASNRGIDEIRNLRDSARYAPTKGKYKVYIIDEVHMLTREAFNALLKTLEEPPPHVLFIFATTEIHKLPATILSRCQRFDFRRISVEAIRGNLQGIADKEGLTFEPEALQLIARKGDGSLRDAQSIFDQVVSLCGSNVSYDQILQALHLVDIDMYFRVTDIIKARDVREGLALVNELMAAGHDIKDFLSGLSEHLRNLTMARAMESTALIEASDVHRKRYAEDSRTFSLQDLLRMQRLVQGTEQAIRWSAHPRFKLEADLIQLITLPSAVDIAEALQRVDDLKKKLRDETVGGGKNGHQRLALPPVQQTSRHFGAAKVVQEAVPSTPIALKNEISHGEISSRWEEFLSHIRGQKISLGSVLESSTLLGVEGGAIRLGCGNQFVASSIKRNRELLASALEEVFHVRARIEVEILETFQSKEEPPVPKGVSSPPKDHPIVQAIIRELGAEPLS